MRWELFKTTREQEIYHLYNGEKKVLTLELHSFSNTARIDCENEKRVFLIRREGLRRNKTVIRNEYGVRIGEIGMENKEQFIQVNEEKFFFTTLNNPLAEMILYKDSKEKPVLSCGLDAHNGHTAIKLTNGKSGPSHPGLLMALCWYMFLPVAKDNLVEFSK